MCRKDCFLNSNTIGNRKIMIWGAGKRGQEMARLLGSYGCEIEGFVDSYLDGKEETVCGLPVYGERYLEGKWDSLFVLVSMDRYYKEVREYLYAQNYTEITDFCWLNRTTIEPEVKNGIYQDDFGNVLKIRCGASKLKVVLMGKNNHLDIDDSVSIKENMTIYLAGGSDVSIKNSSIYGTNNINVVDRSSLIIEEKSIIGACTMNIRQSSSLTITDMLLEDGSSLETADNSDCKLSGGVMDGICKVTNYSILSMEQVYSKATKITVYRKGNVQIRKTKLEEKVELFAGSASKAEIFDSEIGKASGLKVGNHSVLCLKQTLFEEAEIRSANRAEIVAEESTFGVKARISADRDTKIHICSMTAREEATVLAHSDSRIQIGRNCQVTKNLYILTDHGSSLTVGKDCAFAQDVTILSGDSHPVFQIDHPRIYEACSEVRILDYVWLGKSSVVLSNAVIGEGCIVAPDSVVGKKYPNNCLLMGYPAKIVRQDIAYHIQESNPDAIDDKRYWKHTDLGK